MLLPVMENQILTKSVRARSPWALLPFVALVVRSLLDEGCGAGSSRPLPGGSMQTEAPCPSDNTRSRAYRSPIHSRDAIK